jgi:hypothetical protein
MMELSVVPEQPKPSAPHGAITMTTKLNDPESAWLTADDSALFESARQALHELKRTFDNWVVIGRAIVRARAIANLHGGKFTFQRLLMQQGLTELVGDKGSMSRLEKIMAHLPHVEAWRFTLTERQKIDWAAPNTVFKHCPLFKKPGGKPDDGSASTISPMARLKQQNEESAHKVAHLEERLAAADAGSLFDLKRDSVDHITDVVINTISWRKTIDLGQGFIKAGNIRRAAEERDQRASKKAARAKTDRVDS